MTAIAAAAPRDGSPSAAGIQARAAYPGDSDPNRDGGTQPDLGMEPIVSMRAVAGGRVNMAITRMVPTAASNAATAVIATAMIRPMVTVFVDNPSNQIREEGVERRDLKLLVSERDDCGDGAGHSRQHGDLRRHLKQDSGIS